MGNQECRMIDPSVPPQTLRDRTLEAAAEYIKSGSVQNVVVMVGAGISTSAGIPDFRSKGTGLYDNLARLNLPHPEAVFEISFFRNNPEPFYVLAHELYPGNFRPTITHSFLSLLHQKGLLMKLFTQNIDCLEREAGVPMEKVISAHGSFATQSCIDCKKSYPEDCMREAINTKIVPHCISETCNGLVKPDIVFFGEQLPGDFFTNRHLPALADLVVVMGTSLSVHPFAALPQLCDEKTPRILINGEIVGDLGTRTDDVLLVQDCDGGVRELAQACGWLEELEAMWKKTEKVDQNMTNKQKENKSRDEKLQEEVEKLTREVEENLRLSKVQHSWLEHHVDNKFARASEKDEYVDTEQNLQPLSDFEPKTIGSAVKTDRPESNSQLSHVFPFANG